nr:hypothetical protein [Tanacetum cinerariifolium]
MDACGALTKRVEHLQFDKVAQALEITKLKRRVKKLEKRNTMRKLKMIAEMDQDDVVVLEDDKEEDREVADAVKDVKEAKEDETEPAEIQEVVDVITTAKLITKFVTAASEIDEAINHVKKKAKEDPAVKRYQVLKRKPQTEAQARKNMMMYLKNVADFKMDYFKGMSYDDIRPIFEAKFNSNVAFLLKIKEQIDEDENRALQKLNKTPAKRSAKRRKLDKEAEELKRHLQIITEMNNKPYYKIIRADDTHQLYVSFLTLLKNFDREYLEALWSLVKEIFSTTKPKNFFDDFLLVTLRAMFEKPDIHAQIWKNQRTVHGPAKVKGWKLLESCGVQIIAFTSTQLILLVERKYPLIRFTLNQMLNAVRLEIEDESEVSLELLRFTRQQHHEDLLE